MDASEKLGAVEATVTDVPFGADPQPESEPVDNFAQPEQQVPTEDLTVVPSLATIKETKVKNYDPKRSFGPLTPAQSSLHDALIKIIPDGYPSKESLSKTRAREICFMGGRAIHDVRHVSPMSATEIL